VTGVEDQGIEFTGLRCEVCHRFGVTEVGHHDLAARYILHLL
jgi:hypothetical protein